MMGKEKLQITSGPFVPSKAIQDITNTLLPFVTVSNKQTSFERHRTVEHFDFQPNRDLILLFVGQVLNFVVSALKEMPKELLKDQLKELIYSVVKNKKEKATTVQIKLSYRDVKAEMNGEITAEHVVSFVEGFSTIVATDKLITDYQNPHYHKEPVEWRGVKYNYDANKKLLLPYNFEQHRQEMYKRMRDLGH